MPKKLPLLFLFFLLLTGCNQMHSKEVDLSTAKKIALQSYPDYEIISAVTNACTLEPYYILSLSNGHDLYVIKIAVTDGAITQANHQSIDSSAA